MFGVMLLTLYKAREPAFLIIAAIGAFLGYCISEIEPLATNAANDSLIAQIVTSDTGMSYLLTSTLFAFAFAVLLAIFTGATDIPRDIDTGMIMVILAKPLKKSDYMLGKYFGVLILCSALFLGLEAVIYFAHLYKTHEAYGFSMVVRQLYLVMALVPLVGITVSLSCFLGDLAAMIMTAMYILFSLALGFIPIMVAVLPKGVGAGVESYLFVLYYFFPNYIFYFQTFKLLGIVPFSLLAYSVAMAVIFLIIGAMRLQSRDLSPNG
jgi:ABC-type transport system involved in multi-copper enzyme maturation permease subunit